MAVHKILKEAFATVFANICKTYDLIDWLRRRNSTFKEVAENERDSPENKVIHIDKEKETASTLALQQLIARVLVDPETSIPLDSNSLHKKVALSVCAFCTPAKGH